MRTSLQRKMLRLTINTNNPGSITNNVYLIEGDAKKEPAKLKKKFDRILMPLPKDAGDFLESAFKAAKKGTMVHFYTFANKDEFGETKKELMKKCKELGKKCRISRIVKCGAYAPHVFRVCIDFRVL